MGIHARVTLGYRVCGPCKAAKSIDQSLASMMLVLPPRMPATMGACPGNSTVLSELVVGQPIPGVRVVARPNYRSGKPSEILCTGAAHKECTL